LNLRSREASDLQSDAIDRSAISPTLIQPPHKREPKMIVQVYMKMRYKIKSFF